MVAAAAAAIVASAVDAGTSGGDADGTALSDVANRVAAKLDAARALDAATNSTASTATAATTSAAVCGKTAAGNEASGVGVSGGGVCRGVGRIPVPEIVDLVLSFLDLPPRATDTDEHDGASVGHPFVHRATGRWFNRQWQRHARDVKSLSVAPVALVPGAASASASGLAPSASISNILSSAANGSANEGSCQRGVGFTRSRSPSFSSFGKTDPRNHPRRHLAHHPLSTGPSTRHACRVVFYTVATQDGGAGKEETESNIRPTALELGANGARQNYKG